MIAALREGGKHFKLSISTNATDPPLSVRYRERAITPELHERCQLIALVGHFLLRRLTVICPSSADLNKGW